MTAPRKRPRSLPLADGQRGSFRHDGSRIGIVPADVRGPFATVRRIVFAVLVAVLVLLPWLRVGGRPAVLLDVANRRFFLLGLTLNAQDAWLLFFVVTGVGFGLVYVTTLLGRVFCGWACPQTVFLEGVYRRIERAVLGSKEARKRRQKHGHRGLEALRVLALHALYVLVSFALAHVFLGYFVSPPALLEIVRMAPSRSPEAFAWTAAMTVALYGNFAWFREQLCVIVCPYGRLQSALVDADTMIVGYDAKRGEPRGKAKEPGAGDCVDCGRCVAVCPTGIDIRDGLQLECVGCTA
ncbi:4Fe-4S binding protein, partial [bacterium]